MKVRKYESDGWSLYTGYGLNDILAGKGKIYRRVGGGEFSISYNKKMRVNVTEDGVTVNGKIFEEANVEVLLVDVYAQKILADDRQKYKLIHEIGLVTIYENDEIELVCKYCLMGGPLVYCVEKNTGKTYYIADNIGKINSAHIDDDKLFINGKHVNWSSVDYIECEGSIPYAPDFMEVFDELSDLLSESAERRS
jgi:hypothetical protein